MPDTTVTAGTIEPALDTALDLVALEDRERRIIHRPCTPEPDSIVEHYVALGQMIVELAAVNGVQLDLAQDLAGWGDRLVTALRDGERNQGAAPLTGRALSARLRPLIVTLADPQQAARWPQARGALHDLFAVVSADRIFAYAVTHHLGADKTARLMRLHDQWRKQRRKNKEEVVA